MKSLRMCSVASLFLSVALTPLFAQTIPAVGCQEPRWLECNRLRKGRE